ncbi:hypothetical protein [Acidithiobacillus ferriphilus]|uniref:hypothetical protein n=1 Tax=Acidithiobacillus ferriphilus TaxID=1689834 RepID=UPI001D01C125|nr:hypothetical protein [Acidithiobacillus ferriphilus]
MIGLPPWRAATLCPVPTEKRCHGSNPTTQAFIRSIFLAMLPACGKNVLARIAFSFIVMAGTMTNANAGLFGHIIEHAAAYAAGGVAAHEVERHLDQRNQGDRTNAGGVAAEGRYAVAFPLSEAEPNPRLTPGALNPAVTQANIRETICRRGGYTKSIRPPEGYTEKLKREGIRQYGYTYHRLRDYEEDHLISLEIGGSPDSPQNLWPEPHHVIGGWGSYTKDKLENRLHALVCHGQISLATAQHDIATNWIAAYKQYVGPQPDQTRSHHGGYQ